MYQTITNFYRRFVLPYRLYIFSVIVFMVVLSLITSRDKEVTEIINDNKILVRVATPQELYGNQTTELIGKVAAKTQVDLQSEVSGRVTAVYVSLGQNVVPGQIIATLENASERASVLSAEGVYEAAQAVAAQSGVGVSEAENSLQGSKNRALSAYKSAYEVNSSIISTTVDPFFSNPNTTIPGLRISGRGYTSFLNAERVKLRVLLPAWLKSTLEAKTTDNLPSLLGDAMQQTKTTLSIVDTFILILQDQNDTGSYTSSDIQAALVRFNNARTMLSSTVTSLEEAGIALVAAEESYKRAQINSSSNSQVSSADAQIKQALGGLRAAQASLSKTIIRTPIAGEVNSLSVKTGDFLGSFSPVAKIANNKWLEITTYVGQGERSFIQVGSELMVDRAGTGTVTNISPAIDANTGKIEVKVGITNSSLQNGDTVRLFIKNDSITSPVETQLPLSAIKFDGEQAFVFIVKDSLLERLDVELGVIRGDSVVIKTGLVPTTAVVVDARGKVAGSKVEVTKNN